MPQVKNVSDTVRNYCEISNCIKVTDGTILLFLTTRNFTSPSSYKPQRILKTEVPTTTNDFSRHWMIRKMGESSRKSRGSLFENCRQKFQEITRIWIGLRVAIGEPSKIHWPGCQQEKGKHGRNSEASRSVSNFSWTKKSKILKCSSITCGIYSFTCRTISG